MGRVTQNITEYSRDGLTFDVTDRGDPAAPAVILLHGFPEDRQSWDPISDRLVGAGLRTLAPDQRGYSPRARPSQPYPQAYALPELVDDVMALADTAGLRQFHLVGHDWGGGLAWTIAGAHPDRVATLTVLSTPHPAAVRRAITSAPWQFSHSLYILFFQRRGFRNGSSRGGSKGRCSPPASPGARPPGMQGGCGNRVPHRALGWYRAMRHSRGAVHRSRVPTTLVWGRQDIFWAAWLRRRPAPWCSRTTGSSRWTRVTGCRNAGATSRRGDRGPGRGHRLTVLGDGVGRMPVTVEDVRAVARDLPRAYEVVVHNRVKFRVGQIVWLAFSRDETTMGFAFPKEEREALVASDPGHVPACPGQSDLRFHWVVARMAALDVEEMRELVLDAWRMVVPKSVARAYDEAASSRTTGDA